MKAAALALLAIASVAHADRPLHGDVDLSSTFLLTGDDGDRTRYDVSVDVMPYSRFGALVAWRQWDRHHHGLLTAGLVFEAAAARPRLHIDLHADAGVDLDHTLPLVGGGVRTTLDLVGPLAIAVELGSYLVIGDVASTRFVIASSAALAATF